MELKRNVIYLNRQIKVTVNLL